MLDYSPLHRCRSRRSMKRDESKETYKLPHRLIEKKRRDRINECIAQLKDLLPEHLKLTTLGHLEKAVVLELTLKHVKTLTTLTEQLHQKIIALQNGDRSLKSPPQSDLDAFHSGFQTCTKEVLHYLSRSESWTSQEQHGVQLLGHLHSVCTRFLPDSPHLIQKLCGAKGRWSPQKEQQQQKCPGGTPKQETQPHCVPVIQRTQNWSRGAATPHLPPSGTEQAGEHDTDTDSGYGGEYEGKTTRGGFVVKQEPAGEVEEAPEGVKRRRLENGSPPAAMVQGAGVGGRADPVLLNPLMALGVGASCGLGGSLLGQAPTAPFCLPFYFLAPSVAAAYMQPFLEKISPEKSLYPAGGAAGPFPFIYPGISVQGAAAAFPSLVVAAPAATLAPSAEKGSSPLGTAPSFPTGVAPDSQPLPPLFPCKPAELNTDPDRCPSPKSDLQPGRDRPLQANAMLSSI
ncbi:class E basic helix-loop-helix protein 41 isoform X2 [Crotalus tigris]|uniref:class E basic helix-loop-helix protein 41 isoform X2 n=1 Tax=Crotalus tigris TaxID=88082 RepID=UPI00192F846E|nr:class E basic helix-loop-helix protein 41 isoform X2 [Crotalus tigris]